MTEKVKLITARRAYEFRPNELRLTMLSLAKIREHIQKMFSFEIGEVQPPPPVFGPVQLTVPPGIVFQTGGTQVPEKTMVPIRFMHFEPSRIVIDVGGPSSAIDYIFVQLQRLLADIRAPDGSPIIGEPWRVLDYSEISGRLSFGFDKLLNKKLRDHTKSLFGEEGKKREVVPLGVRFISTDGPGGSESPDIYTLEIRDADQIEDEIYTSSADMPTDRHLAWLEALGQKLSSK